MYRDDNDNVQEYAKSITLRCLLYVNQGPRNKCQCDLFRSMVRMSHNNVLELAHDLSNHELFGRWLSTDCKKRKPSSI